MAQARGAAQGLRVVIADRHHLTRLGLAAALAEAGAEVSAQVADSGTALAAMSEELPDALVVSLELPAGPRGHLAAIARDRWPGLAIVVLSANPGDESVLAALHLGASAHVAGTADAAHVVAAVRQAVTAPGAFVADDVLAGRRARGRGPRLTRREAEVLALAAEGLTVEGISARLFVSPATTRSHLAGIYRKLGVSTRSQAVLTAERLGMLRS